MSNRTNLIGIGLALLIAIACVPYIVNKSTDLPSLAHWMLIAAVIISTLLAFLVKASAARIPLLFLAFVFGLIPFIIGALMGLIPARNIHAKAGLVGVLIPSFFMILLGTAQMTGGVPEPAKTVVPSVFGFFAVQTLVGLFVARYMAVVVKNSKSNRQ